MDINERLEEILAEFRANGIPAIMLIADVENKTLRAGGVFVKEHTLEIISEAFGVDYFEGIKESHHRSI